MGDYFLKLFQPLRIIVIVILFVKVSILYGGFKAVVYYQGGVALLSSEILGEEEWLAERYGFATNNDKSSIELGHFILENELCINFTGDGFKKIGFQGLILKYQFCPIFQRESSETSLAHEFKLLSFINRLGIEFPLSIIHKGKFDLSLSLFPNFCVMPLHRAAVINANLLHDNQQVVDLNKRIVSIGWGWSPKITTSFTLKKKRRFHVSLVYNFNGLELKEKEEFTYPSVTTVRTFGLMVGIDLFIIND